MNAPTRGPIRFPIYVFPTRYGLVFFLVLLGLLLGAINHNNNLAFLFAFLLGGVALVCLFHTHRNLSGLEVASVRTEPVFAGQPAVFDLRLCAGGMDRPGLNLALVSDQAIDRNLNAGEDLRFQLSMTVSARGPFQAPPLRAETRYPLGLFRAWCRIPLAAASVAYPRPLAGELPEAPDPASGQADGRQQRSGVEDFQGLRTYAPGDPPGHISWKALSRGQGLFTKVFMAPENGEAVWLDWNRLRETDVEARLSRLCFGVLAHHRTGRPYGLRVPGATVRPATGEVHLRTCLTRLAMFGTESPP